jgi:hypothetical protein
MVDKSPAQDKLLQRQVRVWEPKEHRPTLTWSRSGYKPYSTYVRLIWMLWMCAKTEQSQEQVLGLDTCGQGTTVEGYWYCFVHRENEMILSANAPQFLTA